MNEKEEKTKQNEIKERNKHEKALDKDHE